jgi:hypothetical protein
MISDYDLSILIIGLHLPTMKIILIALFLTIGFIRSSFADKEPVKYGKIDKADLINIVYAPDTSAPAVILCDYGHIAGSSHEFVRILRIKILKKEGYDWANQTFSTDSKTNIRGITYNLEGDNIVETKLKNESIFETRITENHYEMRVAMPNVKVGSVIDIEFVFYGIPYTWDFQQEIPVVHSELIIEPNTRIDYRKNYFGYIPLTISTDNHWESDNVPAFKPEPFITSSKNYRTRFEFDNYISSWDIIREILYNYTYFGAVLNTDGYLKSAAQSIKANCATQDELIKAAYKYTKQMKWNKTERVVTEKTSLNSAFKEGKGNSAEVNMALIQLLRLLDINAAPVILSTRSNGRLSENSPSIFKLNYLIAAIITDKDTLLLDATEANSPYYLLPMRVLNGKGQLMAKKSNGWIQLVTNKKDKQMEVFDLSIEDDMSLKGKISYLKGDYAALEFRNDYENFNSDEDYISNFKEGKKGLKIVSHKIENLDSLYKSVNEEFEIVSINSVSEINGELYLVPLLFEQIQENPFKAIERKYPVDFGYARDKSIVVNYTLPAGYSIVRLPANANMKLPGNTASYICKSTVTGGKVSILYKLNFNKSMYLQSEYADLREFYNQVIAKHAEPIVLRKN